MGKLNHGPNTKAKGKAGAFVYQQYEGMQVFKEYQPNVMNPSTPSQVASRACFALASKVTAAMFPYMGLVMKANGINYERFQRGEVLNKLRKITTYDAAEAHAVLGRLPEFRPNGQTTINLSGVAMAINSGSVRMTITTMHAADDVSVEGLIVGISNDGKIFKEVQDATVINNTATIDRPIPADFNGVILGFAYCLEESSTGNITVYGNIAGATADNIATLGTETTDVVRYDMSNLIQGSLYVA